MTHSIAFDRCEIFPDERVVRIDGEPVVLGARAFDLLLALIEHRDRVVTKSELFDAVWPGLIVEENNLQVQVSSLRKLLGPAAIATVAGRGYRFTAPIGVAPEPRRWTGATPGGAADGSARSRVLHLAPARTRFIGREAALEACTRLLSGTRLLTLSGIGGCGKTRLAQELAIRHVDAFPDGLWFVDLGPVKDAARVAATIASALGVQEAVGTPLGKLVDQFRSHRSLVVLDNCEHVIDSVIESVEVLLERCEALKIVATSREVLGIAGEQVFPVRSLSLPAGDALDEVRQAEAIRLFVDHARLVMPEFECDATNGASIAEICRRLDGIALAIELAAARVRVLSVEEIRARLDQRFLLLTGGSRAVPRHRTLTAAMQWSYELLAANEQRLLRRLSVFAGGGTLTAVTALTGGSIDEYEVLETLTALHDKSLVIVDHDSRATPRYRMLETVRQYAEDRLQEANEAVEARTRHLEHCVALALAAAPTLRTSLGAPQCAALRRDQENILAAHAWCAQVPDGGERAIALFGSLWQYWCFTGQEERGYHLGRDALALAGGNIVSVEGYEALHGVAYFAMRTDRRDEQQAFAERALALARQLDDPVLLARGHLAQGDALAMVGDQAGALCAYAKARELCTASRNDLDLANVLNAIAEVERERCNLDAAQALYEEALALDRACGSSTGAVTVLYNLTGVCIAKRDAARATATLREGITLAEAIGFVSSMEGAIDVAAALASLRGAHRMAAKLRGMALTRMRESNVRHEPVDEGYIDALLATTRASLGDVAFDEALAEGRTAMFDDIWATMKTWLAESDQR